MSTEDQLKAITDALRPWCAEFGGSVKLAHDRAHMLKVLGENPGAVRAAVMWAGDKPRDEMNSDVIGRADHKIWIAFSRGYNLEGYPGKSLVDGVAGGQPMFKVVRAAKSIIRKLRIGAEDEPLPFYHGTEMVNFEGVTLDVLLMTIEVSADDEDETTDDNE
ncbi:MAG: hypothetical protein KGL39_56950 [Patescibacteria group bacterium]|nr:hypothetical protein [Patescibacteria group bacterium]